MNYKALILTLTAAGSLMAASSIQAATIFITNNTTPKTLASNEGDGAPLNGAGDGTVTALTLSADDGGGTINLTTVDVSGTNTFLFMDGDSMGHANDKWGANQNWTFTFDQTISFDALTFKTINENMTLRSTAWVGDANATGTGWSFDGTTGEFTILGTAGAGIRDFTSAGVADVAAGTEIGFGFFASASGGEELTSFEFYDLRHPRALHRSAHRPRPGGALRPPPSLRALSKKWW